MSDTQRRITMSEPDMSRPATSATRPHSPKVGMPRAPEDVRLDEVSMIVGLYVHPEAVTLQPGAPPEDPTHSDVLTGVDRVKQLPVEVAVPGDTALMLEAKELAIAEE
ncbi:MAG TPA: hypothetical protein VE404_03390, partial [Verrucomicrobiae bacterium]|nr:hypothetical protein [Verrucomicrobiae bacterium]